MKHIPNIAGGLLGLAFIAFSLMYFFKLMGDQPPPPEGSAVAHFMAALIPTGYMNLVKTCELLGGIMVAIPRTRNIGLLFLGPVIVNIAAFHIFVARDVTQPETLITLLIMGSLAAYLLWAGRKAFAGLLN
jgi:putative oxidoreductase